MGGSEGGSSEPPEPPLDLPLPGVIFSSPEVVPMAQCLLSVIYIFKEVYL